MAAGQRDIPVLLQPGSGATVRAPGEFMYLAFADREILAIVTGQDGTQSRLKMVTGDFTKPAGGIEEVELVNPDPDNACAVTVIIGAGEFDRKIIQGEVTITPGIRGADGQFVDDTRSTVRLRVALGNITPQWGSRDFPSKNDKVLWRPRRLWPPEGYYFFRDPYLGSV